MHLDEVAYRLHNDAKAKGFYESLKMDDFNSQAKQLAMIHSEVSETLEALRKQHGEEHVVEELSDILVRVFDFYGALREAGVVSSSLHDGFLSKVEVNKTRPRMHGVLG